MFYPHTRWFLCILLFRLSTIGVLCSYNNRLFSNRFYTIHILIHATILASLFSLTVAYALSILSISTLPSES